MRIRLERFGGVVGRKIQKELDTDGLPANDALRLKHLLQESKFFHLPPKMQASTPGADRFNYILTVQSAGRAHTVEMAEEAVPKEVRPLLEWILRG